MFRSIHLIIAFSILFFIFSSASTQQENQWTDPFRLSAQGAFPSLAVDYTGQVHIVWTENQTGLEFTGWGDTLFYATYFNGQWSEPVDIIVAPQGSSTDFPSLIVDNNNYLHLFWRTGLQVFHSFVNPTKAKSALNWSSPVPIVYFDSSKVTGNVPYSVVIDKNGRFHMNYLKSDGITWSLEYILSDNGVNWSSPQRISVAPDGIAYILPRIAVASDTIHMVWTNAILPDGFPYTGVYYLHSMDSGVTWSQPIQLGGSAQGFANIVATTNNAVHVVWNGSAEGVGRYHRWSPDGGITWNNVTRISESGGLTQGWPSLVLDSANTLHCFIFANSDENNEDIYYMYWQLIQGWSNEKLISVSPSGNYTGQPIAIVSYGNQLHITWIVFAPRNNTLPGLWHRTTTTSSPIIQQTSLSPFPSTDLSPTPFDLVDSEIPVNDELLPTPPTFSITPSPQNNVLTFFLPLSVTVVFIGLVIILVNARR